MRSTKSKTNSTRTYGEEEEIQGSDEENERSDGLLHRNTHVARNNESNSNGKRLGVVEHVQKRPLHKEPPYKERSVCIRELAQVIPEHMHQIHRKVWPEIPEEQESNQSHDTRNAKGKEKKHNEMAPRAHEQECNGEEHEYERLLEPDRTEEQETEQANAPTLAVFRRTVKEDCCNETESSTQRFNESLPADREGVDGEH
ncbi:MAG: hypothetical protein UY87_C0016G0034 [Candidatus Peribacteria bacterium GW2011_GWC2_54_8]|nr:MAG: hypothetical protein UY87_C0016G0034 [Candidatus Peribacteria bacterium GW2011_GWC2_54_8]